MSTLLLPVYEWLKPDLVHYIKAMKITILLLHCFITQSMSSKLCFQQPCSADDEEFDSYNYEEALEYCAEVGPMVLICIL